MIKQCKDIFLVRPTDWRTIAVIFCIHLTLTSVANLLLFPYGVFEPISRITGGLINGTLLMNLCFLLVMGALLLRWKGVKLSELRLTPVFGSGKSSLRYGLLWTGLALVIVHCTALMVVFTGQGSLAWETRWWGSGALAHYGNILGQFCGNALYEELLFRSFLLTQCVLLIKKTRRKWSWGRCLLWGLLLSQLMFALAHIPNRIYKGTYLSPQTVLFDQLFLILAGVLLAGIFLLTQNIYAAVGIHAIVNYPPLLIEVPVVGIGYAAYLLLPIIFLWKRSS